MSMLAERKRKTKWVINPTKKPLWTTDSNGIKFGKELMEKMGWSAGKGLGANEQGIQEPLKVSYKNDTKGMGFKGNDNDWIEHQDEFNCFLNQLRNNDESCIVKPPDTEKHAVKSLEEKSKWSKARVHYQKFTRGKDLSKYSEHDLACILGTNKTSKGKTEIEEVIQEDTNTGDKIETNFGVTTINSGSIQDYFKKKWIFCKKKKDTNDGGDETAESCLNESALNEKENVFQFDDKKKSKKKKFKLECLDYETVIPPGSEELEKSEKKKKKKKKELNHEEEPESKKRKKNNDCCVMNGAVVEEAYGVEVSDSKNKSVSEANDENEEIKNQKKKKKEKREKLKENVNESGIQTTPTDESFSNETVVTDGVIKTVSSDVYETESTLKKKKKKSKKEKHCENNESKGIVLCDMDLAVNDQNHAETYEVEFVKKKKKVKKEKYEEVEEVGCLENCNSQTTNLNVNEENIKGANKRNSSPELVVLKQKNKKNKKAKVPENEEVQVLENVETMTEDGNIKSTSEVEVISELECFKKKKKKDKEEKFDKEGKKKYKREVEVISELELSGKKKKRKKREENSAENEYIVRVNEIEVLSDAKLVKKKGKDKKERSLDEEDIENSISKSCVEGSSSSSRKKRQASPEIEFVGTKKMKKSRREKSLEVDENCEIKLNEENIKITNEIECLPEVELVEKKKKKTKKGKLVENENQIVENCDSHLIKPSSEDSIKNTGEEEITTEEAPIKKKKKKKDKIKEVSSECGEIINSESFLEVKEVNADNEEMNIESVEVVKEKKSKKQKNILENSCENSEDKTGIFNKEVRLNVDSSNNNNNNNNNNTHHTHQKSNLNLSPSNIGTNMKNLGYSAKNLNISYNGLGNMSLNSPQNSLGFKINNFNLPMSINGVQIQQNSFLNFLNFLYSYNYYNVLNMVKGETYEGNGVQNHKVELLNQKKADKFSPGEDKTEKLLRLLHLSDFSKFKGSNLDKLAGYGFPRQMNRNKPL